MVRRRAQKLLTRVHIDDFAAEGKCLSRQEGKVIFSKLTAPGDVTDLRIMREKKDFAEAEAVYFHELSPMRVAPFCEHFGVCGGCSWQHIPYSEQLTFKERQVKDALERIGKLVLPPSRSIIASPHETFYRNKLEFTFSDRRWLSREEIESEDRALERKGLGFHIPGRFDKILDIQRCYLQPEPANALRNGLKDFALRKSWPFFDPVTQEGLLRTLTVRTSSTGEAMVILQLKQEERKIIDELFSFIKNNYSTIISAWYIINPKRNDSYQDLDAVHVYGQTYIEEQMEELKFRVGPKSFFQPNTKQALRLYQTVREFADLRGREVVYDLYTGTGTIANFLARQSLKTVGIEYVEEAVKDARLNSELNDIRNTAFFSGDMAEILRPDFLSSHGKPNVVVIDPPRAGMAPQVVQTLLDSDAERMVYVSCNPATQARDLALLSERYTVQAVQPVDMFPHTHHVENIVLLQKK